MRFGKLGCLDLMRMSILPYPSLTSVRTSYLPDRVCITVIRTISYAFSLRLR